MDITPFLVPEGRPFSLRKIDPGSRGGFKEKEDAQATLERDLLKLEELQELLYASGEQAVLIILQAMDSAGKDGVVKHVMSGVNPQGVSVVSFKAPSTAELEHDFLWRHVVVLPRRGMIGIFNRSYYEEVLVVRVHPELLAHERLPGPPRGERLWKERFEDINCFERFLTRNGIVVLKFFLHLSRTEQKKRLLARIDTPEKNWKFSADDLKERARWDDYMSAYEQMLGATSTAWAPWHVIPADHKWVTRVAVSGILVDALQRLDLRLPAETPDRREELAKARKELDAP